MHDGRILIAGILAHELAHPLDDLDKWGFQRTYGRFASYQAREYRADLEGCLLLRMAQLPPDALYRALKKMHAGDAEARQGLGMAVNAGFATHPEDGLRFSALRLFLTHDFFTRGDAASRPLAQPPLEMLAEIRKLDAIARAPASEMLPTSLTETIGLLEARIADGGYKKSNEAIAEFNRLWLRLYELLVAAGENPPPGEEKQAADLFLRAFTTNFGSNWVLANKSGSYASKLVGGRSFALWRDRVPLFRSPRFREALRAALANKIAEKFSELFVMLPDQYSNDHSEHMSVEFVTNFMESLYRNYITFFPHEDMFEILGPVMAEPYARVVAASEKAQPNANYVKCLLDDFPLPWQYRFEAWFYENVWPLLDAETRCKLLIGDQDYPSAGSNDYRQPYFFLFPRLSTYDFQDGKKIGPVREKFLAFLDDPANVPVRAVYAAMAREMWARRGEFGVIEILSNSNTLFDWELIVELAGLAGSQTFADIRTAVKEYTRLPDYAELIAIRRRLGHINTHISGYGSAPLWADETLLPFLEGRENPVIQADDKLKDTADYVSARLIASDRDHFARHYVDELTTRLNTLTELPDEMTGPLFRQLVDLHRDALRKFADLSARDEFMDNSRSKYDRDDLYTTYFSTILPSESHFNPYLEPLRHLFAIAVERSTLDKAAKKMLLKSAYFLHFSSYDFWMRGGMSGYENEWRTFESRRYPESVRATFGILRANGVFPSLLDMFEERVALFRSFNSDRKKRGVKPLTISSFYVGVANLAPDLERDIKNIAAISDPNQRKQQAMRFARAILNPASQKLLGEDEKNTRPVQTLKAHVIEALEGTELSAKEKWLVFLHLTATGPTLETDRFFAQHIFPHLDDAERRRAGIALGGKRFASAKLKANLAGFVLEPKIAAWGSNPDEENLRAILREYERLVDGDSSAKDEWLENLAWRLELDEALTNVVEEFKSTNWRKINPELAQWTSFAATYLENLDATGRFELIRHIVRGSGDPLPESVVKALQAPILKEVPHQYQENIGAYLENELYRIQKWLESVLGELTPEQRIPLIENLLHKEPDALTRHTDFPYNITRELIGYIPGSVQEKMLTAYLRCVPTHEIAPTLAYIISFSGEDKTGIRSMFEAFHAVGVKTGQLAAIFWKDLDDATRAELSLLKDRAKPITRVEVFGLLSGLPAEERRRIRRLLKILGSASLRTAVLVELDNGDEAVLLARRPHAETQVAGNLKRARKLLDELRRDGFFAETAPFVSFLDAVAIQLFRELEMSREAAAIKASRRVYDRLNTELADKLRGWRFAVPDLIPGFSARDDMVFVAKADGVTLASRGDKALPKPVGAMITAAALRGFFGYGLLDADRHRGNYMIDEETKTIFVIDFGQTDLYPIADHPLFADDMYRVAQLLWGAFSGDARCVARYARELALPATSIADAGKLVSDIRSLLENPVKDRRLVIDLNDLLETHGIRLRPEILAGVMKGLMVLWGEGYVNDAEFTAIIGQEVKTTLHRHWPRALAGKTLASGLGGWWLSARRMVGE